MADSNATVFPSPVFNPLDQTFTLSMSDGSQWEVSMADLDFYRLYALRICINYASQIGASLMLLVVLCVLTRREKRAAPVFILNASCLLVNSVRSITNCLYYTGPWYNPYVYLSHDYSSVPESAKRMSVASNTLVLLLVMLVMASLILQVRVMLITTSKIQRFWVMVASITVAMLTIGFRFTLVVLNNKAIMNAADFYDVQMILNATYITQAVSIWFFCVIFLIKLGFALAQRKKLGIRQLGPMQIIFIMGCQTMIVPAIFTALNYAYMVYEFASQTLTVVCLFLPLSAIWAGTAVGDRKIATRGVGTHRKLLGGFFDSAGTAGSKSNFSSTDSHSQSGTCVRSPASTKKSADKSRHGVSVETAFDVARGDDMV